MGYIRPRVGQRITFREPHLTTESTARVLDVQQIHASFGHLAWWALVPTDGGMAWVVPVSIVDDRHACPMCGRYLPVLACVGVCGICDGE